jgi:phospholipid-binding lipoprotein MlaA
MRKLARASLVAAMVLYAAVAVAADPMDAPAATEPQAFPDDEVFDQRDPWESMNRSVFRFNTALDNSLFRPVARGYRAVMPDPLETGVSNFFSNLGDVTSAVNNALQGKLNATLSDASRVIVNSTLGLLGFVDFASKYGDGKLPKRGEDFGQTLGVWGFDTGPYLVLPLLGPSSARDFAGWTVDFFALDPLLLIDDDLAFYSTLTLRYIDRRAAYLTVTDLAEQAALDPYVFYREAYFQKRGVQVRDGEPPADF